MLDQRVRPAQCGLGEDDNYDAHAGGCDLEMLEFTTRDLEIEEQMVRMTRLDGMHHLARGVAIKRIIILATSEKVDRLRITTWSTWPA